MEMNQLGILIERLVAMLMIAALVLALATMVMGLIRTLLVLMFDPSSIKMPADDKQKFKPKAEPGRTYAKTTKTDEAPAAESPAVLALVDNVPAADTEVATSKDTHKESVQSSETSSDSTPSSSGLETRLAAEFEAQQIAA